MRSFQAVPAALCLAAACCTAPAPAPTPPPITAAPRPTPTPTPPATTASADWMDRPASVGSWIYRATDTGSLATYVDVRIACDRGKGVSIMRFENFAADGPMTIRTESVTRTLAGVRTDGPPGLTARLSARDPLLDAMAFSKGRFAVEAPSVAPRYLPSWAEVTRVIEDCR